MSRTASVTPYTEPMSNFQFSGWSAPRNPLPPYRLAKIANALGVSTPIPALQPSLNITTHAPNIMSASQESLRRSPIPGSSLGGYCPLTSRFLLHVVPPLHLPHDSDDQGAPELVPPPPNASGYHPHFRRGTLVPMYPTLQLQLAAIAKEYALPSTAGMVLYLVLSSSPSDKFKGEVNAPPLEKPGPRLSEDIWGHLWTRVIKADNDEMIPTVSRNSPRLLELGMSIKNHSSPYFPHYAEHPTIAGGGGSRLVELSHPRPVAYPPTPSSLSPLSTSDTRSDTRSAPPYASSSDTSITSPVSPAHESSGSMSHTELELPGLHSSSYIPVLAKIEFDIDRRRAAWYDPWLRSRKMNHARRAESRAGRQRTLSIETGEDIGERKPLFDLTLLDRVQGDLPFIANQRMKEPEVIPEFIPDDRADIPGIEVDIPARAPEFDRAHDNHSHPLGYEALFDEPDDTIEPEPLDEPVPSISLLGVPEDPLSDVFGTDAKLWEEMRAASSVTKRFPSNPDVLQLALTSADLDRFPDQGIEREVRRPSNDEQEIREIIKRMSQAPVVDATVIKRMSQAPAVDATVSKRMSQAPMVDATTSVAKRRSSRWHSGTTKRAIPPPLTIPPLSKSAPAGDSRRDSSPGSSELSYLRGRRRSRSARDTGSSRTTSDCDDAAISSRLAEMEKRDGGVFDNFDLGLEELGDDEMNNQFLFKSKLDELEKTLALFSPRTLTAEDSQAVLRNSHVHTPSLKSASLPRTSSSKEAKWPAVPFHSIPSGSTHPLPPSDSSPPQLTVNGVSTSAPRFFVPNSAPTPGLTESEARKRDLADTPTDRADLYLHAFTPSAPTESPIIPLSPDPFGRFSSTTPVLDRPFATQQGSSRSSTRLPGDNRDSVISINGMNSSRFSADSSITEDAPSTRGSKSPSIVSVKSLRKLWRKTHKSSVDIAAAQPTTPPPPTPILTNPPSGRPSISLQQPRRTPSPNEPVGGLVPRRPVRPNVLVPPVSNRRADSLSDKFHFDQESPYPVYPARSPVSHNTLHPPQMPYTPDPSPRGSQTSLPDKEKAVARKSILKWKNSTPSLRGSISSPIQENRGGQDARLRRPSLASLNVLEMSTSDVVAPSPAPPGHSVRGLRLTSSRTTSSDSSRRTPPLHLPVLRQRSSGSAPSEASSMRTYSASSRDSVDTSHFEMVSPRALSGTIPANYPYQAVSL